MSARLYLARDLKIISPQSYYEDILMCVCGFFCICQLLCSRESAAIRPFDNRDTHDSLYDDQTIFAQTIGDALDKILLNM